MEHTLTPNKPPKFPGYYFFIDLRNGTLDIISVFEGYREKKILLYAFINDEKIYTEDELSDKLHFHHAYISIPEELINASSSYKRFLNAKKDVRETEESNQKLEFGQKVHVWDGGNIKVNAIFIEKVKGSDFPYKAIGKESHSIDRWIHCEAYEW